MSEEYIAAVDSAFKADSLVAMDHDMVNSLDGEIDSEVDQWKLWNCSFHDLLIHFLYFVETADYYRHESAMRHEVLQFALPWIYRKSKTSGGKRLALDFDITSFGIASEVYERTFQYDRVNTLMWYLHKGFAEGFRKGDTILVLMKEKLNKPYSVAERLLFGVDEPGVQQLDDEVGSTLFQEADRRIVGNRRFEFNFPSKTFEELVTKYDIVQDPLWQLDPSICFEHYSLADFRRFFTCLAAYATIQRMVNNI